MRIYTLFNGQLVTDRPDEALRAALTVDGWNSKVMAQNDCTEDDLKAQIRIVLSARSLGLFETK